MPLPDDLLNPIEGPNPSGANLRYDPVYDKIKEARREEDAAAAGHDRAATAKSSDNALVIKLTTDLLTKKTKDLQLAAWLTEASLKQKRLWRTEGWTRPVLRPGREVLGHALSGARRWRCGSPAERRWDSSEPSSTFL